MVAIKMNRASWPDLDKGLDLKKFSKRNDSYSRSLLDYQDFQENFLILLSIYMRFCSLFLILWKIIYLKVFDCSAGRWVGGTYQHFDLILRLSPLPSSSSTRVTLVNRIVWGRGQALTHKDCRRGKFLGARMNKFIFFFLKCVIFSFLFLF